MNLDLSSLRMLPAYTVLIEMKYATIYTWGFYHDLIFHFRFILEDSICVIIQMHVAGYRVVDNIHFSYLVFC